eukprot:1223060-Amphidinium_carterae.1
MPEPFSSEGVISCQRTLDGGKSQPVMTKVGTASPLPHPDLALHGKQNCGKERITRRCIWTKMLKMWSNRAEIDKKRLTALHSKTKVTEGVS